MNYFKAILDRLKSRKKIDPNEALCLNHISGDICLVWKEGKLISVQICNIEESDQNE